MAILYAALHAIDHPDQILGFEPWRPVRRQWAFFGDSVVQIRLLADVLSIRPWLAQLLK
jgi:hypothetical protein